MAIIIQSYRWWYIAGILQFWSVSPGSAELPGSIKAIGSDEISSMKNYYNTLPSTSDVINSYILLNIN